MQIFFRKIISDKNNIHWKYIKATCNEKQVYKKHPKCDLEADNVMKNGILIGCHQGMKRGELNYICNTFKRFINLWKLSKQNLMDY